MKKVLLSLLMLLSFCFCHGQNSDPYIQRTVDSLDRVQPVAFKKVKPRGCTYIIKVRSQKQFDAINDELTKSIKAGKKNIQVKLERGVYHFHQEHIRRVNEKADVSISFIGKNAIVTSDKNYSTTGGKGSGWQEMRYADSIIQVVDEKKKLCLIPYANGMSSAERKKLTKVQIPQWFRAKTYTVERIDQKGIYFIASELAWDNNYGHKGYNVNYDYLYLGKTPRFRLYNSDEEPDCTAARFLTMKDCSYHSLVIKGIVFRSTDASNVLMHFTNVAAKQITISKCTFDHIRGNGVGYFNGTGNVVFDGNTVSNTGGDELFFSNNCFNIRVTNNTFQNCGQNLGNYFCVRCYEATYYIAHNAFRDFGYGAIGVGVWHGFTKNYPSKGIIEHNEIYFTPAYFANAWKYMLMDSGAIYTWTQNDGVVIRYNYIHDYSGAGDNRGMFCDDGACNLKIYGNVVMNIPNSYCIDSRKGIDQHEGFTNNANNFMAYNVVDGRVRFQGYGEEERHCVKGANYVVKAEKPVGNKIENLETNVEDVVVQSVQEVQKFKEFKNFKVKIRK